MQMSSWGSTLRIRCCPNANLAAAGGDHSATADHGPRPAVGSWVQVLCRLQGCEQWLSRVKRNAFTLPEAHAAAPLGPRGLHVHGI